MHKCFKSSMNNFFFRVHRQLLTPAQPGTEVFTHLSPRIKHKATVAATHAEPWRGTSWTSSALRACRFPERESSLRN